MKEVLLNAEIWPGDVDYIVEVCKSSASHDLLVKDFTEEDKKDNHQ